MSTRIKIKPYLNGKSENMGLTKEKLVVFPTIIQSERMACVENNGRIRYLNGLDEFAPEIKGIKNEKVRSAKIKEIREIVAKLEKEHAFNTIDPEDKDFWSNVKTFRPDNREVFGNIRLECGNDEKTLNPSEKYEDLLLIKAIEAGGFSLVAKSYEDLLADPDNKKWYLDKEIETVDHQISPLKLKNKAVALFDTLFEEKYDKLFYICKVIMVKSIVYNRKTLNNVIYRDVNDFLDGKLHEREIGKAAKLFIDTAELSMEDLKIKSAIKDLIYTKDIVHRSDGMLYVNQHNAPIGRSVNDALEYYKNPANDDMLRLLLTSAETLWQG